MTARADVRSRAHAADTLSRFVFEDAALRGTRVRLSETSRTILESHDYPPALRRVLAELTGAAALLAAALKFDGRLSVQLVGDGPVRLIVVECNASLALRATAQWDDPRVRSLPDDATLDRLAGGALQSRLAITLDPRKGPLYQGIVELRTASVAATIEHYLSASEQVASKLALVVDDRDVAGVLLQRLPASGPDDDATWARASAALDAATLDALLRATSSDDGLATLFAQDDLRVFQPSTPRFECSCSRSRVEGALRIAGRDEIEAALRDDGEVEVVCEFCGCEYTFAPGEARALFEGGSDGAPPTRH
ncbi:MAG TPA: Hsp33 family molecular chaperone HslO [Candidatus Saccharimonadia bacterium]|nr:Hsp33 family molecular chaperone HslO [Candidatus Saccharimonadia bacterium]